MMSKCSPEMPPKYNDPSLKKTANICLMFSVGFVALSIANLQAGICTIVFAHPEENGFHWPVSSCSGIWASLLCFACGMVGVFAFTQEDFSGEVYSRRPSVGAYWGLLIATMATNPQHLGYSITGLANCLGGHEKYGFCEIWAYKQPFLVAEGFSVFFAALISIFAWINVCILCCGGRYGKLLGVRQTGCCGSSK